MEAFVKNYCAILTCLNRINVESSASNWSMAIGAAFLISSLFLVGHWLVFSIGAVWVLAGLWHTGRAEKCMEVAQRVIDAMEE